MRFIVAIPFTFAALASTSIAGARSLGTVLNLNLVRARSLGYNLLDARQTPNVPQQCQATCSTVLAAINNNCTPAQCCTTSFEQQLFDCFTCLANVTSSSDFTTAQATVDDLYDACAAQGLSLPILTFPGEDPNRPLSSVSGSPSSTQSQSQSSTQSSTQLSQTTVTSLTGLLTTNSQSTVTSLSPTTALPNVTAAPSSTSNSAGKIESGMDLRIMLMMIGSLVAGSLLVLS